MHSRVSHIFCSRISAMEGSPSIHTGLTCLTLSGCSPPVLHTGRPVPKEKEQERRKHSSHGTPEGPRASAVPWAFLFVKEQGLPASCPLCRPPTYREIFVSAGSGWLDRCQPYVYVVKSPFQLVILLSHSHSDLCLGTPRPRWHLGDFQKHSGSSPRWGKWVRIPLLLFKKAIKITEHHNVKQKQKFQGKFSIMNLLPDTQEHGSGGFCEVRKQKLVTQGIRGVKILVYPFLMSFKPRESTIKL